MSEENLELSVHQLYTLQQQGQDHLLLDVREMNEWQFCRIEKSMHIPLGRVPLMCEDLPRDKLVIVYCHHGLRSLQACQLLRQRGFDKVKNLKGGIDAWAKEVDKTIKTY